MSGEDIHTQVGAYALDALSEDQRIEFEAHLRTCASCRQEARGLTETTALLGSVTAQQPPPGLRDQVMSTIGRTRQLPPPVFHADQRRSRWVQRATALAAAACLLVAVAFGVLTVRANQRIDQLEAQQRQVESVLSAPDVRVTTGRHTGYGTGTVAVSEQRDRVVFTLDHPRHLGDAHTYQLWFVGSDGAMRSAGLLADDAGMTSSVVADGLGDASGVGLTVEPEGGSRQPTTDPLMLLDLA